MPIDPTAAGPRAIRRHSYDTVTVELAPALVVLRISNGASREPLLAGGDNSFWSFTPTGLDPFLAPRI
jgi:hypothetical protein